MHFPCTFCRLSTAACSNKLPMPLSNISSCVDDNITHLIGIIVNNTAMPVNAHGDKITDAPDHEITPFLC